MRDVFRRHGLLDQRALAVARLGFLQLALQLGDAAVGESRRRAGTRPCAARWRVRCGLVELLLEVGRTPELLLLGHATGGQPRRILPRARRAPSRSGEPFLRRLVLLQLQRLALDLELHDAAVELVERLGLGIDLHPQPRRGFVDQVDRLVGQEAVGDVAVRQRRRRDQRRIGDAHLVVLLVFLLEAAQDRDRVLDAGLVDQDRLETPGQSRVLLDMLAVFVERGRADAVQLAARQRRLQQVGRIHRAVRLAGADQRVHLVDEQDDAAGRRR